MKFSRAVFVIHNMAHQGRGPFVETEQLELPDHYRCAAVRAAAGSSQGRPGSRRKQPVGGQATAERSQPALRQLQRAASPAVAYNMFNTVFSQSGAFGSLGLAAGAVALAVSAGSQQQ
jgi:hypothetical protein